MLHVGLSLAKTWPVPSFILSTLCCLLLHTLSCLPTASEQLAALHTWLPFLSCLWHLGSAQGSSCCACLLVSLPKLQLLIPALSPIPTSGIFAHPWMAEYSFPPGLIAVNTNSSSFFRLFCRFWCLPNCSHSLTPLQTAPPQKAILSVQSPSSPPSPSSWAEWSGCPPASNRDRLLPPPANSQQTSVSSSRGRRVAGPCKETAAVCAGTACFSAMLLSLPVCRLVPGCRVLSKAASCWLQAEAEFFQARGMIRKAW